MTPTPQPLIRGAAALLCLALSGTGWAAQCPDQIDTGDCVANDLQPTGTEIIEGPSSCTEGDVFSAKVRILFESGGGANNRFNVGFFVGDNGESPIGGTSCTFDSLQPLAPPLDLTGGSGGFLELNGDACGDIQKGEPTYKDIQLDQILCKDDDGDGNVDVSYVLTWENNGNQANCTDPLDPAQFDPAPPKCRSDLEYDLPIAVEDPPSIEVGKGAFPSVINAPGGLVRYAFTILNTSPESSDPVLITDIIDEPFGDVTGLVDCVMPFALAPSQSRTCFFIGEVTGQPGDVIPDRVTVFGRDNEGQGVSDSDTAEVRIVEEVTPDPPGDLRLVKFASPTTIDEPGGTVQYDVLVANVSPTPVTLLTLEDDLYGDLNGKGSCSVPQELIGLNSLYFCSFQEVVIGQAGDVITDTIIATGVDALPTRTELVASDTASVTIRDVPSDIEVVKVANPSSVPEPGSSVDFTLLVQNNSTTDVVTIERLLDNQLGVPKGNCATPFTLLPGGDSYTCTYPGLVGGNAGDFVTNVVTAGGTDDDGDRVFDFAAATVTITGAPPSIQVTKTAVPPFAVETGSPVLYVVGIQNTSSTRDPVTITSLVDKVPADDPNAPEISLDGIGNCDLTPNGQPLVLAPAPGPDSFYVCGWVEQDLSGPAGTTLTNEVTAAGVDDEGVGVSASDRATVRFLQQPEPAPDPVLELVKFASPTEVPEPGDEVVFTVVLANGLDAANGGDLTVTSLTDEVDGVITDLDGVGTCQLPIVLPPQQQGQAPAYELCQFAVDVIGNAGDVVSDTVRATAVDAENRTATAEASASVTILDVPASLAVSKTAQPSTVLEPGDDVTFTIVVQNTSQSDRIFLESLVDNVYGDLMGQGLCPPPTSLFPGRDPYRCEFTVFVGGAPGDEELNTVTAAGTDDDGQPVEGSDQASVVVLDSPPSIITTKSATPTSVPTSGATVTFTSTTTNTSAVDSVTLESLVDSVFGDLDGRGTCSVPQTLGPGESYSCTFEESVSGMLGETHLDEIEVSGTSDDGDAVSSRANAIVTFFVMLREAVPVPVAGPLGLVLLGLLLGWFGVRRARR